MRVLRTAVTAKGEEAWGEKYITKSQIYAVTEHIHYNYSPTIKCKNCIININEFGDDIGVLK
jgi:hypothetical protein